MGLFSSDTRTSVGTSVVRVMEDEKIPDTVKHSIMKTIMSGEGQMTDNILEDILNGPTVNIERFYRKAKDGDYIYGLPNAHVMNRNDGSDVVKNRLEVIEGQPITMQYLEFASLHPVHAAYEYITTTYNYNRTTNELPVLSAAKGFPVYLSYITPVFPVAGMSDTEIGTVNNRYDNPTSGYSPDRMAQQNNLLGDYRLNGVAEFDATGGKRARIYIAWVDDTDTIQRQEIGLDLSGYPIDFEYFQAKYTTQDGATKYWTYQDDKGTYPEIDAIFRVSYTNPGTYFPFVLFRRNRTNRTHQAVRDTEEYKSTADLVDTIGMDFGAMGDSIHENPDIADVEQAAMMMAVPANSQNPLDLRYLFDFFSWLQQQQPEAGVSVARYKDTPRTNNAIVWRDADFRTILSYGGITKKLKPGKLGKPGTYHGSLDSYTITETFEDIQYERGDESGTTTVEISQTVQVRVYQHQVNESMYEEIRVTSPTMRYDIWEGYEYLGASDSDKLLIPVDRSISDKYNLIDKEKLYYRSLQFVFNSRVTETVKWYESGLFQFVLIVSAIALTIYSGGAAWQTISAAVGVTATVIAIAKVILISIAIQQASKLVIKELGPENGFLVAIVLVATAFVDYTGVINIGSMITAQTLLVASSGLSNAVASYASELSSKYQSEMQSFNLMAEKKTEELEEAMALLDNDSILDPFEFIGKEPKIIPGESPDNYYNRTIHAGNIGMAAIKSVESYVDISLTLPDIQSTIGDT